MANGRAKYNFNSKVTFLKSHQTKIFFFIWFFWLAEILNNMRLIQKVILIILLYFIKLQMKQKELELENETGSETELEYFFKGKKLRQVSKTVTAPWPMFLLGASIESQTKRTTTRICHYCLFRKRFIILNWV